MYLMANGSKIFGKSLEEMMLCVAFKVRLVSLKLKDFKLIITS